MTQQQVNTYGTRYALAVESITVYYLNGKPAGYRDYWDFDSKPWGQRSTYTVYVLSPDLKVFEVYEEFGG